MCGWLVPGSNDEIRGHGSVLDEATGMMDAETLASLDRLVELALEEDLRGGTDCTSQSLIPGAVSGSARFVSRDVGVVCGIEVCARILSLGNTDLKLDVSVADGQPVQSGQTIAQLLGDAREILKIERVCLNFLGRLSGIATLTRQFVDAVAGTGAQIHDTRKTTPGWRRLEKYAVKCGGGTNHRMGLYDAVLIKDNHLAMLGQLVPGKAGLVEEAVGRARSWIAEHAESLPQGKKTLVQIEVDNLNQLASALVLKPDMILLDNMSPDLLREAVTLRDKLAPGIELEASGGVNLKTVAAIARTGVDRISVGALTHSATNFDIGLDWQLD